MRDHLEYYNNLDVKPLLQAVEKLFNANKELGLDALKSSLTLLGSTLHLMFSDLPPGVYFTLINQSNSDLHQLITKNVKLEKVSKKIIKNNQKHEKVSNTGRNIFIFLLQVNRPFIVICPERF